MSETYIKATITVGDEEIKLAVHDDKYMDPRYRWDKLHQYFLSLELQAVEKLGIPQSAYRLYLEKLHKD